MVNAIVNATNLTNSDSNRGKGDNAHDTQNLNFYSFDTLAINPTKLKALLTSDGNIVKITDDSANGIHLGSDKIYTFYALKDDNSWVQLVIDKDSNGYATSFKITLGPTFGKSSGPVAVGDKITVVSANVVSENGIKAAGTRVEFIVPTP